MGGHQVEIVDRDQAEAQKLAGELGENATALDPGAPLGGEIKVVVDITNPVDNQTWDKLATPAARPVPARSP